MAESRRTRRPSQPIDGLPGLFDDIDISRPDIAGDIIVERTAVTRKPKPKEHNDIDSIDARKLPSRHALRFISFGSGSSGNCAYVGTERGGILIDAGIEGRYVTECLLHNGIDADSIRGILLTHDHSDHVKYAYSLLRHYRHMRLFCTPKTLNGMLRRHNISRRIKDYHTPFYKEFTFDIADMSVTAFDVAHDGTDNVGFFIHSGDINFTVVTDTGHITERADFYLRQSDAMMIEANYDARMLHHGSYPEHLKARIASDTGHLDNADTASYLASIASPRLRNIFLCHLSHDNNQPEIALGAVRTALMDKGFAVGEHAASGVVQLSALPRFEASRLYVVTPA